MSIDYQLICDVCGKIIDGSMYSAAEVRRVAKKEETAYRRDNKDICRVCFANSFRKTNKV